MWWWCRAGAAFASGGEGIVVPLMFLNGVRLDCDTGDVFSSGSAR